LLGGLYSKLATCLRFILALSPSLAITGLLLLNYVRVSVSNPENQRITVSMVAFHLIVLSLTCLRNELKIADLRSLANRQGIRVPSRVKKAGFIDLLLNHAMSRTFVMYLIQCSVDGLLCSEPVPLSLLRRPHKGPRNVAGPKRKTLSARRAQQLKEPDGHTIMTSLPVVSSNMRGWDWVRTI